MVVALYISTIRMRIGNMAESNININTHGNTHSNTHGNTDVQVSKQTYDGYMIENMMACNVDVEVDAPIGDEFVNRLHETLDIYQLLNKFISVFKEKVSCDGIEYKDETTQTYFLNGVKGQPCCIYTLRYEEEILGTISISRDSVFQDYEVEIIEVLLAGLTLPLRNALRYKQSVQYTQRDELTGLRSGSYYHDIAELEVKRAKRYKTPFSILLFDINDFDLINNKYGRSSGDAVLIEIARRLEKKARSSDVVYRNNGDEFLVFLPNTKNDRAIDAAERIKSYVLKDKCTVLDNDIEISISMSVTTVACEDTASKLMERARKSLLNEKMLGKNHNDNAVELESEQVWS